MSLKASEIQALLDEPACTHNTKEKSGCAKPYRSMRRVSTGRRISATTSDKLLADVMSHHVAVRRV